MKRTGIVHAAAIMPRRSRHDSRPRLEVDASGRDRELSLEPGRKPRSSAGGDVSDHRGVVIVVLFSLLAFGWLLLMRNVRAGLPGNVSAPKQVVGNEPIGERSNSTAPGVRAEPGTLRAGTERNVTKL